MKRLGSSAPVLSSEQIPPKLRADIRRKLLRWYDRHKRDLPWRRRAGDPYAQWVAEIMLQQTRVETVIRYYDRFIRRFPTLKALALARHTHVLKHWEGLGYYRRILFFHRAAKLICERDGVIPKDAEELRELPGVGEYTAAAISSIAFGQREAAVDGNVERVLARLFDVRQSIRTPLGKSRIRSLATQLLSPSRPGDFNQAWMDLGSQVCIPRSPRCSRCPLAKKCTANLAGTTLSLPNRHVEANLVPKAVSYVTGVFVCDRRFLVRRRPTGGLWSGLWEFPTTQCHQNSALVPMVRTLAAQEGVSFDVKPRKPGLVKHQLTHRSLTFYVYVLPVRLHSTHNSKIGNRRWVTLRGFRGLAVSTAHRKIFSMGDEQIGFALNQHGSEQY